MRTYRIPTVIGALTFLCAAWGLTRGLVTSTPLLAQQLPAQAANPATMRVITASRHAKLDSLGGIIELHRGWRDPDGPLDESFPGQGVPGGGNPGAGGGGSGSGIDPVLQKIYPLTVLPAPLVSFDGIGVNGGSPSDANVAIGTTQVVEIVNTMFQVFDKNGVPQAPAAKINTLFSSLTDSSCSFANGGDPIVLFDQLAGRWLISQLEIPRVINGVSNGVVGDHVCVGISTTADALGAYNLYDFVFDPTGENLPDYPKFGIWPDAYYFSANTFQNGGFIGGQACAFDRLAMIAGVPGPTVVCFQSSSFRSLLPSSLDGSTPPPAGSPNYFLQSNCCTSLSLFKFRVNFVTPSASIFAGPVNITVARFATSGGGNTVPQRDTSDKLEDFGGSRLLYRLSYRNFGTFESLLASHSVQIDSAAPAGSQSGVRWYEILNPAAVPTRGNKGGPVVNQQSTYSPDSTTWRWMGSIGQDKMGNMLLGYSASSPTTYPSIRYAGRRAGLDPLNQMEQEGVILIGIGSQLINPNGTGRNRWGDYTSVAVDPTDDCTMWFVNQYLPYTSYSNWMTHLASFKFEECQ